METDLSYREKRAEREISAELDGVDRFVDMGVRLWTVVTDLERGELLIEGAPPMRVINVQEFGGVFDTADLRPTSDPTRPLWSGGPSNPNGISPDPLNWYCSADQEPIILHADSEPLGQLVHGSEGAGKTAALAMWHYFRWQEHLGEGRMGGQFAPNLKRLGLVQKAMEAMYRKTWGRYVMRRNFEGFEMCDGSSIFFQSTHKQSAAAGSPVQGSNLSWTAEDEKQDMVSTHNDIISRGRAAKNGRCKRIGTATAKDDPAFRDLRDKLIRAKSWHRRTLSIFRSPFITQSFLETAKETMSAREFLRRYGDPVTHELPDLLPELATYDEWSREQNLIVVPEIGWTDVTSHELRGSGDLYDLLVGHDPGALWHVSLLAKAYVRNQRSYLRGQERPFWVVHGEVNDEQSTSQVHINHLLETVRERWHLNLLTPQGRFNPNARQMLVRADPADLVDKENANTHKSVYTQFANAGIKIKPAAYNADNDGHGKVPKDPGIEVIKTLIRSAGGVTRLYVEKLADGSIAAPRLVEAIESCQRDERGQAETMRKGPADKSHWTAALRYMLWAIERPRLQAMASRNA